jgi:hypothetical protein
VNIHGKTDVKSLEQAFVSAGAVEVKERINEI